MDNEERGGTRLLLETLEADVKSSQGVVAFLVPSTRSVIERIDALLRKHPGPVVVGPSIAGSTSPAKLLYSLRSVDGYRPPVIVFADQLVGPDVATVPTNFGGHTQYVSGLETVLQARYGYILKAFVGDAVEMVLPSGEVSATLALIEKYLASCDLQGEKWLVRDLQASRRHDNRVRESKLRTRYFQSAVFHHYANRGLDAAGRQALLRIDDVMLRLTEQSR